MKISVLMPAYNSARFLADAIESVLAQTHRDFEFIIIDDGSNDDTLAISNRYAAKDPRVKVISHANLGMGKSLNEAMTQATGDWIARIDADDLMLPQRLERQIEFLQQNPSVVVASSLVEYIDKDGKNIGRSKSAFTSADAVAEYVRNHWPIGFHHPAAIFRKSIIQQIGGYRPQFWPADDMDLWNRVIGAGHAILVQPEYLTRYRIHGANVTVGKFSETERKAQWVEACMTARREKQAEPTWEQFEIARKNRPLFRRMNDRRRDIARGLYKAAVFEFSRKRYQRFVPGLLAAAILEPRYVLQRVLPQLRRA